MTNPTPHGQVPEALRFTKKPVTIEAIQWTGKNLREVIAFTDASPPSSRSTHAGMAWEAYAELVERDGLKIYTLEGKMLANHGDWIIRGVKGEYYPCKPDIFEATYSPAAPVEAQQPAAHVQNPAEIEHVAGDVSKNGAESNMTCASHGQAPAQAAPAAMHSDLRARCVEVLAWRETGTLPGEALRTLAREKYGDRHDAIQRAERDTETEALNLVAARKQGANHD